MVARTVCSDLQILSPDSYPHVPGTILLHLYAAALAKRAISPAIPALYIPVPSPFPALEAFTFQAARLYNLSVFTSAPPSLAVASVETLTRFGDASANDTVNMREALELYRARFPSVVAILIGTRRTDPHGGAPSIPRYAGWFYLRVCSDIGLSREDRS
jgi:FAD synthetase